MPARRRSNPGFRVFKLIDTGAAVERWNRYPVGDILYQSVVQKNLKLKGDGMPILGWFDTSESGVFAKAVAEDLMGRIPLAVLEGHGQITPERERNAHEAIMARAGAFARMQKLNWYKKAHLGNTFRWTLLEKGYDKAFVEAWTHNILVALTSAHKSKNA